MKRILCIDCQVFQTPAWDRGMGKYSLNLLQAYFKKQGTHYDGIELLFNTALPDLSDEASAAIAVLSSSVERVYIKQRLPGKHKDFAAIQADNIASLDRLMQERHGSTVLDFVVLSLFLDEACVVFPTKARKILLFYDLIPFLYHNRYEARIPFEVYLGHFRTIFKADLILTISQTVADDLAVYLGLPAERLVNINGASIDRSKLKAEKPAFDVPERYILMPSGEEIRKNNLRAVKGFEEFVAIYGKQYKLIITSRFSPDTVQNLETYSDNIIFTGNIAESQLQWLFEHADLLLFASEYEGLGLPVLEAVSVNKPIACSNIPVFQEISPAAFYFFDHLDTTSIAHTIEKALTREDWDQKHETYGAIMTKYSWAQTAKVFDQALASQQAPSTNPKRRIAIFTPHPAGFSAIGKVNAEAHATMSQYFDIDYYFDYGPSHRVVRSDYLSYVANCFDAADFNAKRYADYDAVIYHVGNSEYHLETIKNSLYLPGIAILHDTFLEGAYKNLEETGYILPERFMLESKLNITQTSSFLSSVVNAQRAVITHSTYAAEAAEQLIAPHHAIPVKVAALPVGMPSKRPKVAGRVAVGLAGILADVKGLGIVQQLINSPGLNEVQFHIFGHVFGDLDTLHKLSLNENVRFHANPTDFEFQTELAELDVLLNYRLEYRGETSLTVLEAMRNSVTVIVRDIGWYAELPSETVRKVTSEAEAVKAVVDLVADKELRETISAAAYEFVRATSTHQKYAEALVALLQTEVGKEQSANSALTVHYKATDSKVGKLRWLKAVVNGEITTER